MTFTHCLNTPQIKNSFGEIHILGTIKNIDYAPNTTYITLKTKSINNQYANIRFSLKDTKTKFQIIVDTKAELKKILNKEQFDKLINDKRMSRPIPVPKPVKPIVEEK